MQRMYKKYIEVEMLVDKMGDITPLALIWDGERYEVDKIIRHKPQCHSKNCGGGGQMFVVQIGGATRTIYYEYMGPGEFRWFIESLRP